MSATKQRPAGLTLFEIASEYRAAAAHLQQLDLDEQTVADTLESMEGDLVDKLCAVVAVSLSMEAEAEQLEAYVIERTQKRIAQLKGRSERLRSYALDTMRGCQKAEVQQPDLRFRVRANPLTVVIDDAAKVPPEYMRTPEPAPPPVPVPDKKLIGVALKAGKAVDGARGETKYRLELF